MTSEVPKTTALVPIQIDPEYQGLKSSEFAEVFAKVGPNALPEKVVPAWRQLFHHLWGSAPWKPKPIPLMMWLAIIVSGVIQDWIDFGVILALHLLNTFMAYHEERKAGDAVAALKNSLAPRANVCRDGKWDNIEARNLVPGDLVRFRMGELCPADCQLIQGECLIDQSGLTGESLPVKKKPGDLAYGGTCMKAGEILAVIRATGPNTEFGKTAALIAGVKHRGEFQRLINKIAMGLVGVALLINAIMITVSLSRKQEVGRVIQRSLVLIVASVPIALPMVCTTILAAGSRRLAAHNAVVTRLSAVEELAGMSVLCSDKTGTLTLNQLQMDDPWISPDSTLTKEDITTYAALSTVTVDPEPIDVAVRAAAVQQGASEALSSWTVLQFIPFDPSNRRTTAIVLSPDRSQVGCMIKGAAATVLDLCSNKDAILRQVDEKISEYAGRGLRTIAVAVGFMPASDHYACSQKSHHSHDSISSANLDVWNNHLKFVGLLSMFDPPREDSAEVIKRAQQLGVRVKMISGDHHKICVETGRRLGLGSHILQSERLRHTSGPALSQLVQDSDGFSEVFPEDKYNIVAALQATGINCGMTGDGVNDAAALKKANVGFAVKGATPAAQSAADVVLLSEGLSVIITAIMRSRKIFQRVKNYCIYRINISLTLLFFFATMIVIFDESLPAIIIVLMALLNDFTIMTISTDKVVPSEKPDGWHIWEMIIISVAMSLVSTILSVLSYLSFRDGWIVDVDGAQLDTLVYMQIALMNQITVFVARTHGNMFSRRPGTALLTAILAQMVITTIISLVWPFGSGLSGVPITAALLVWLYTIVAALIHDGVKLSIYQAFKKPTEDMMIVDLQSAARGRSNNLEANTFTSVSVEGNRV